MEPFLQPGHGRADLTFSCDAMSARNEALFKSFVRIVDHRTRHRWTPRPEDADLRVTGESLPISSTAADQLVLVVGVASPGCGHRLKQPIHAHELEVELNLLGDLIASRGPRKALHEARTPSEGQVPAAPGIARTGETRLQLDDLVHLVRWPSPSLLTSHQYIRLATLMTGRPLSLRDVQRRSGSTPEDCTRFLMTLSQAGLIVREGAASQGSGPGSREPVDRPAGVISTGLLARIRARLGFGLGASA